MNDSGDIDYLLDELVTLPSMPGTLVRVTQLLEDPSYDVHEVAKVISADPGITLKTLRLANSAYYGLRQPVATVDHAMVLLGERVIRNLVLTATAFDALQQGAARFVRHSVSCAVCMRAMRAVRAPSVTIQPEEAFVYGLIHDIGKVILEQFLPEEYGAVERMALEEGVPVFQAERDVIGLDHARAGARLAEKWKLPPVLAGAIAGHHDLSRCSADTDERNLAAWLAVADYISIMSGFGAEPGESVPPDPEVWGAAGFTSADMPEILESFFEAAPGIGELLGMVDS